MTHHKRPLNNFYKVQPPTRIHRSRKTRKWSVIDHANTVLAEGLTKEIAETFMQAVNYCGTVVEFTKMFVEWEHIVTYREDVDEKEKGFREEVYGAARAFLLSVGMIEPPPLYVDGFSDWETQLTKELYANIKDRNNKNGNEDKE